MAAAQPIIENKIVTEIRTQFQNLNKIYDKDFFEVIEHYRREYESDENSKEILAELNKIEDERVRAIVQAFTVSEHSQQNGQESEQTTKRLKRYIADKNNELRLLDSARKKFNESVEKCLEENKLIVEQRLKKHNLTSADSKIEGEKSENISDSLANFVSAEGELILDTDAFSSGGSDGRSSQSIYLTSRDGLAVTLKQIAALLEPGKLLELDKKPSDEINILKKLQLFYSNKVLVLSLYSTEFNLFLNALQKSTTLTELDLYGASNEDCLAIIPVLRNNSSLRTFYWPESLGPFNNPKGRLGKKIKEEIIGLLDRTNASSVNRVEVLKRVNLEGDVIDQFNMFSALKNCGLKRIEITINCCLRNPGQRTSLQTLDKTNLQNTLVDVDWVMNGREKISSTFITKALNPLAIFSNITSLRLHGDFDFPLLLTTVSWLPLQNLNLSCSLPKLTPTCWDPLEKWGSTLNNFTMIFSNTFAMTEVPAADNLCKNLKKLSVLNTLRINAEVFCDHSPKNKDKQKTFCETGLMNFLAAIDKIPLATITIFDASFGIMFVKHRATQKIEKSLQTMLENSLAQNHHLCDVQLYQGVGVDIPNTPGIAKSVETNKIRRNRWSSITTLISFIRASRTSAIRRSIIPLLPQIQELAGFKIAKSAAASTAPMVFSNAATNLGNNAADTAASTVITSNTANAVTTSMTAAAANPSAAAINSSAAISPDYKSNKRPSL